MFLGGEILKRSRAVVQTFNETIRHPMAAATGVLTAAQGASAVISLVTTVVAARMLGPNKYGEAAMLMAFPTLISSFFGAKSSSVTLKYLASFRVEGRLQEASAICKLGYAADAIAATVAFLLVAGISPGVTAQVLRLPDMEWIPPVFAASLVFSSFAGTSAAVLISFRRFQVAAALAIFERGVALMLIVGSLLGGMGASGLVLAVAGSNVISGLAMLRIATQVLKREGAASWWKASLKSVASIKGEWRSSLGWNFVTVTLGGIVTQFPLLLLGRVRGPHEAALYRIATSIYAVGSLVEGSLWRVSNPVLVERLESGGGQSLRATFKRWTLHAGLPLGAALLAVIPALPVLVRVALGVSYNSMVFGAQMMLLGAAVSVTFFYLSPFYYASGRVDDWAKAYGIYSIAIVGFSFLVVPEWGFRGMAVLLGLGTALFNFSMAFVLSRTWARPANP